MIICVANKHVYARLKLKAKLLELLFWTFFATLTPPKNFVDTPLVLRVISFMTIELLIAEYSGDSFYWEINPV